MTNFENIIFLNKEIIVKELLGDNILDHLDDSEDLEKLVECEIVKVGLEVGSKFKVGDKVAVQRDGLKSKRYFPLEKNNYFVVFHENTVFCKIDG